MQALNWIRSPAFALALLWVVSATAATAATCPSGSTLAADEKEDAFRALLSLVAYLDQPPEIEYLGTTYRVEGVYPAHGSDSAGLAYTRYRAESAANCRHTILVFRGTESSWKDWAYGNLPLLRRQYRLALRAMDIEIRNIPAREPIELVGHSLGGGIASTLWRYYPDRQNIHAIAFNSSPLLGCLLFDGRSCTHDKKTNYRRWRNVYDRGDPTRWIGNLLFPHRWNWFSKLTRGVDRNHYYRKGDYGHTGILGSHSIVNLALGLSEERYGRDSVLIKAIRCIERRRDQQRSGQLLKPETFEFDGLVLRFDNGTPAAPGAIARQRQAQF